MFNNINKNESTADIYVVFEILDPNLCFAGNQSQYIKYDNEKYLSVIASFEDYSQAEIECGKQSHRHIVRSKLYKSIFTPPSYQPNPGPIYGPPPFEQSRASKYHLNHPFNPQFKPDAFNMLFNSISNSNSNSNSNEKDNVPMDTD